ncbi:MAG: MmgE/PrpD family protein [Burkholderiales bacterium]
MRTAERVIDSATIDAAPLAVRIARSAVTVSLEDLPGEVIEKVKTCLFDLIGCAFEARDLPWSRQAVQLAERVANTKAGGATVIGSPHTATYTDAAFANAVMGHALVREDMHSGSISHLGIVVLPTVLSLAQYRRVSGREFVAATAVGYEVGGRIGRAVMDAEVAKIFRPTGITGPVAAAAAGARLLGLSADAATSAVAFGANTTVGYNQWAHTGGSEMYFHAGFAARNAVTAARLAELGAFASPSALDGEAGMFAALGKQSAASKVALFAGQPEILSVYHKPVPACNFAQTACQAAIAIARENRSTADRIASITVRVPRAGKLYPGCDYTGPFAHRLQAKMSIQYNVAAALLKGGVSEQNFTLLNDPALLRLLCVTTLQVDDEMTRAYPGKQGGEVELRESGGKTYRKRLDDVVNATASDVRLRFRAAAEDALGAGRAREIESFINTLEASDDVGRLGMLLRSDAG